MRPTLTCRTSCKRLSIRSSTNYRANRLRPHSPRLFPPRSQRLPPRSRRRRSPPRPQRPPPPLKRSQRQSAGGPRRQRNGHLPLWPSRQPPRNRQHPHQPSSRLPRQPQSQPPHQHLLLPSRRLQPPFCLCRRQRTRQLIDKARETLRQKMSELEANPAPRPIMAVKPAPAAAPSAAVPAPPAAQPSPAVAQPSLAPAPAPAVQPPHAAVQPTPTPAAVPVAQPPPATTQPAPAAAAQATPQSSLVLPTPVSPEGIEKAREALRQKMKELEGQQPATTTAPAPAPGVAVTKPAGATPQPMASKPEVKPAVEGAGKKPPKGALSFSPIQGPPPSISADKQQRLAELLRKYKADEITAEEYH